LNIFFKSKNFTIFGGFPIFSGGVELVVVDGDGAASGRAILLSIYGGVVAADGAMGRAFILWGDLDGDIGDVEHFIGGQIRFLAANITNFFTIIVKQRQKKIIEITAGARCWPK
jgi:hypothetical protein